MKRIILPAVLALCAFAAFAPAPAGAAEDRPAPGAVAATPPMGWNSYNNFGSSVTEEEVLANAAYMRDKLLSHGWEYVVVDYRWSDPDAAKYDTNGLKDPARAVLEADAFGRLQPAPKRFPSCVKGTGFKPLADKIHAMGLKFGIHIMRGVPRQSVIAKTPVKGTAFTADQVADTGSTCGWCNEQYGVKTGSKGQAWYDSLFEEYAAWGVDFVKVDDLSEPYHAGEIDMIAKAIARCKRPIVFSTSPGETPLKEGKHIASRANMWRASADFWDDWHQLRHAFDLADRWTPFRRPGRWPDLDMLQLGTIGTRCHGGARTTHFTHDEQIAHMTLWCIARSPLMYGGDLTKNDAWADSLITNDAVIGVSKTGAESRELKREGDLIVWTAKDTKTGGLFVALFNTSKNPLDAGLKFSEIGVAGARTVEVRDLWTGKPAGKFTKAFDTRLNPHGAGLFYFPAK